ncbi:glycosyltransferase [Aquimarina sp. 2201CG14-23]|uniref:glycosyltransferase n=1 Tax=Aquimarina mycalae TaxID=3040073 RepID=UPI002477F5B8|nr:glycosyltransferase [Aquimarina sp. 2201CG14-23]MDH7446369.1 glycosyltransferase [Aquimarina sp. 2201CG14-23]
MKKKIVISAINFDSGGPLSIMQDCLSELSRNHTSDYEIIALVNSKKLYEISNIEYIEFPLSKKNWIFRLYYEYIFFYFLSIKIKPDFWLSMHDMTPNVRCKNRFVYCHNPTPFYKAYKKDIFKNTKTFLFSSFYKYLYRINIKKNKYVIVQQDWIRKEFRKFWQLKNVLVAYPKVKLFNFEEVFNENPPIPKKNKIKTFFYPSFPRPFKNFEIICKAYSLLPQKYQDNCKVNLTIDETLNSYSKNIVEEYSNFKGINFLGLLSRKQVYEYYNISDCLIFPSKLETWGLPITEFKATSKPMFLTKESYAKETVGEYKDVSFFDINSPEELRDLIIDFIDDTIIYEGNKENKVEEPYTNGWPQLLNKILINE